MTYQKTDGNKVADRPTEQEIDAGAKFVGEYLHYMASLSRHDFRAIAEGVLLATRGENPSEKC